MARTEKTVTLTVVKDLTRAQTVTVRAVAADGSHKKATMKVNIIKP